MSLEIEVALVANQEAPFDVGPIDARWFAIPYQNRTRVTLEVKGSHSLASALERAASSMNLRIPESSWRTSFRAAHQKIAFYKPEDETEPLRRSRGRLFWSELTLVDSAGRAIFGVHDLRAVSFSELLRASDAKVIEGDPLRPYLILDDGWGDAPPADWATIKAGFDAAWDVLEALAVLGGAAGTIAGTAAAVTRSRKWLHERVSRARSSLDGNPEWGLRGYRPDQFAALLIAEQWESAEISHVLGCSEEQAEGVLWALGYVEEDGLWKVDDNDDAAFMRATLEAISYAAHSGGEWERRFAEWFEEAIRGSEPAPLETMNPDVPVAAAHKWRPSLGQRLDAAIDQARRRLRL